MPNLTTGSIGTPLALYDIISITAATATTTTTATAGLTALPGYSYRSLVVFPAVHLQ